MLKYVDPFDPKKGFVYEFEKKCKDCKHCGNDDYCSNCHSDHSLFEFYKGEQK